MADARILRWLRKIDANIELLRSERDSSLAEIDVELEQHKQQLATHDEQLADQERRIRRLENARARK